MKFKSWITSNSLTLLTRIIEKKVEERKLRECKLKLVASEVVTIYLGRGQAGLSVGLVTVLEV